MTTVLGDNVEELSYRGEDGCVATGLRVNAEGSGASTRTLSKEESGGVFYLDAADGITYNLPTPEVGLNYTFAVTVSVTSNTHEINTASATEFFGGAVQQIIDASDTTRGDVADPTADKQISMNGTTTCGLQGTLIRCTAISSTVWQVDGVAVGSGTLATMFS